MTADTAAPGDPAQRWLPRLSLRAVPVWRRNLRVWRKLMLPSVMGHFGEPVLYLLAFGYGLGALVGEVDGIPYIVFIASGIVCSSAMFTSSFEALYSAYTRMETQQTWAAMLDAPMDVDDVVLGEAAWAGTKSLLSATAILVVAAVLGLVGSWTAVLALPVILLGGLAFASTALIVTALSRSYDFFLYYFTLVMTPMLLLSGVFFPMEQLPGWVQFMALALPLAHIVEVVRPLVIGLPLETIWPHLLVPLAYTAVTFTIASRIFRQRLVR